MHIICFLVELLSFSNQAFHMPKHAFDSLGLFGMLKHSFALEIVESVSDASTSFKFPFFLIFTPELHIFLVLVASN